MRRLVHVIDDDPAVRRSLERLLQAGGFATALYDTAYAFIEELSELTKGCILLDIRMPGMNGIDLQRQLEREGIGLPVVLMTGLADVQTAVDAMKVGAFDFLEKPFEEKRLLATIDAAFQRSARENSAIAAASRLASLSRREREVLDSLVAGRSHKEIAHELGISVRTVQVHRARMLHRLGTRRVANALRLAVMASLGPRPS
jgi:two-component system response regulator FixJ